MRPYSPAYTEPNMPLLQNKSKSELVQKNNNENLGDESMNQPQVNPFNVTAETPEP